MSDRSDRDEHPEPHQAARRLEATSARRHVGAAGFAQNEALEQIISAGREQIALTESIRQVVAATRGQLHELALQFDTQASQVQVATLEQVVRSGLTQIEAADTLERAIQTTLADVQGTPLEDISAGLLTNLGTVVREQARALEGLVAVALREAESADQIKLLNQVGSDLAERTAATEHGRAERELVYLEGVNTETLNRIRQLEREGHSHAAQKERLEQKAESSQRSIERLEAAQTRDLAQIADLEARQQESDTRRTELEATAAQHRDRIEELGGVPAEQDTP